MATNIEEIAEKLDTLTLLEASQLSKLLQERWGVSAAAAVAAPAAGGARRVYGRHDPVRAPGSEGLWQDPVHRRDSQSHRDPEAVVRAIPAKGCRPRSARRDGVAGGVQVRVSHRGLQRQRLARVRQLPFR